MKALVYTKYGSPDVLYLKDVEKPVPKDNQVLVKIHAASLNAADLDYLTGAFLIRLGGFQKPVYPILGTDIAGRVEAVGPNVRQFQLRDAVFGDLSECGFGAFAEYVCVPENMLARKPASMTFEQAATLPQAAILALQGIRDQGQLQPGQKVLINGAGGGVGTFAVQLAKMYGAEVTAVDGVSKLDTLRSLGAEHVIDYAKADFARNGQRYDLIIDPVAQRSIFDIRRALSPGGVYVMIGGSLSAIFQVGVLGTWFSKTGSQKMGILMWKPNTNDFAFMTALFEAGKVVPVIDRSYPLSQAADALRYLASGQAKGKVVIAME